MSKIEIVERTYPEKLVSVKGYTIKERIGVGSYGRVYKVFKKNKYYVLKEIPLNLSTAVEKINSVQNEAQILSSLNNKYVVKFYESFKMNQNIYILMEYCDNGDLCSFLNKIKKARKNDNYFLEEDFVWKLFIQMSIGLYYIHSKKIIHRDIKTLNIFLTKELDAKIGDLGVAKILEDTNHANTFIGTPYYVSPEMCRNKPYNDKSDIWALGCILYELLTFNHPFTANSQPALFIKILNSNFNPFPPGVPEDLKKMVEFILQKDCQERPSMEDIITSYSFQYNAIRIGLEEDLKEVLRVDNLPIYIMNKFKNINNSHTFIKKLNNSKENYIKNQKSSLIISKSVNPLSNSNRSVMKISSNNNIFNKHKNKKDIFDYNSNSHIRLIKNNGLQESEEYTNKRTKSDFNYYLETNYRNTPKKENKIKNYKNKSNKNNPKKYNIINSILMNQNKYNINPRKTKYVVKSRKKLKDFSEQNIKNMENNNESHLKNYNSSKDRMIKEQLKKQKYKNNNNILNDKNNIFHLNKNENKSNNNIDSDIILEKEFMKELNNAIKNNKNIVTLNDLLNHNFNSDDSKNLNTTSATTLLGKIENPSIATEKKYEFNKEENKKKENNKITLKNSEEEKSDIFSGSCDEFTHTEMIKKSEPYLINPIPCSNYEIKINHNKSKIKNFKTKEISKYKKHN